MKIIFLHSAQVEASRNIVAELGGEPSGVDVTVDHDGRNVRIVSKHALAVGVCPNFSGYPVIVVVADDGTQRVKSQVESWAECVEFIDAPAPAQVAQARKVQFTRLEFLNLFADEEKVRLKALESTDPAVALFWEEYRAADSVRLDDPRTVGAIEYLVSKQYLAESRRADILGQ